MEHITIDAGTLQFSAEDMTATGLLIPYGVPARSNLGTFTFSAGTIELPADLTGMSLNVEHKRENVVGAFSALREQPEGVIATFKFADTPTGRAAYADAKNGKRKNLSAEVSNVRIKDGQALPGAILFAGAVVEKPAFEGATLLAAEDTVSVHGYERPAHSEVEYSSSYTDPDGSGEVSETTTVEEVEDLGDGRKRITRTSTTTTTITEPGAAEPADDDPKEGQTMTASATVETPNAFPTTLLAGAPAVHITKDEPADIDLGVIFASMAKIKAGLRDDDAETLLAALSDITVNTTGGLTTAASGVLQPAWVGKLWQGKRYVRKYIDLAFHGYGGIQLGGRSGFTIDQGTALVQHWGGNKTEIQSGKATTSTRKSKRQAYGYAADVAREWSDLEGGAEVLQAFWEGVADSYAKITDIDALAEIFATAAGASLDRLITPDTYPGVAGHDYPDAMGMLIQGIDTVEDADDVPSYAIVNRAARRQLRYTPKDLVPEYVSFTVAPEGRGTADGKVTVTTAPDSAFVGIDPDEPAVIVGAKNAIEFREQGTTPIQVDALNVAKGGLDRAIVGYLETFVVRPESLVLLGTKSA